jgi:putative transposase
MRYPASEKLEIIRLVEQSHLPVKRTLAQLGRLSRPTFYRWYDLYRRFGEVGLEDRTSHPGRVWNRIPITVRRDMLDLALEQPRTQPARACGHVHGRTRVLRLGSQCLQASAIA